MIVISAFFLPIYYRLNVYTAYEYLERRFDARGRYLGALLFLIQRGLAAGITIYAPALILSTILGWPLTATTLGIGLVVVAYTVFGGTRAVSQTQKAQMMIMVGGMLLATVLIAVRLPSDVSLAHAVKLARALERMNPVTFELDPAALQLLVGDRRWLLPRTRLFRHRPVTGTALPRRALAGGEPTRPHESWPTASHAFDVATAASSGWSPLAAKGAASALAAAESE